jgi:hypothetical protein
MKSLRPLESWRPPRNRGAAAPQNPVVPAVAFGIGLLLLTAVLYLIQVGVFGGGADTVSFLLQNLAFLPVQVLLATVLVNGLISRREKRLLLHKMNMVIGTFYAEAGTELLGMVARIDATATDAGARLIVGRDWTPRHFADAAAYVRGYQSQIAVGEPVLATMRDYLKSKRDLFLRLLENPNLLEHDAFTDLLWAVLHVADELAHRPNLENLPDADRSHLVVDIERAYKLLIVEWIAYVKHLKDDYPYLFSLAVRTNPFDPNATIEVR